MSNDAATFDLAMPEMFTPVSFQNPYPCDVLLRDNAPVHPGQHPACEYPGVAGKQVRRHPGRLPRPAAEQRLSVRYPNSVRLALPSEPARSPTTPCSPSIHLHRDADHAVGQHSIQDRS